MTESLPPAPVRLRALTPHDEVAARAAHSELSTEGFDFLLGIDSHVSWEAYLDGLERLRLGLHLSEGWVPATFLVADVAGEIVGRVSIRHELNEWLSLVGGHIGYAVRPRSRRRGYATAMLRHSLGVARSAGVDQALLTCDDDNVGSIKTIERCGGTLQDVIRAPGSETLKRRYWVPTDVSP